jgi:hypothetical protein
MIVLALRTLEHTETLDASLSFHLNLGIDLVLATGAGPSDAAAEVLDAYAREGVLRVIGRDGTRTRAAQLAVEAGAEWVLHADGDEFLWPRGADFSEMLAAVPARYKIVRGLVRTFTGPSTEAGIGSRARRLTTAAEIASASVDGRPVLRVAHRGIRTAVVEADASGLAGSLPPLRAWYPFEVMRFPRAEPGAAAESLVEDRRLQEALAELESLDSADRPGGRAYPLPTELEKPFQLPLPGVVDDADYAADVAAVGETDIAKVRDRLDRLEEEVARLERRFWSRVGRKLDRLRARPRP